MTPLKTCSRCAREKPEDEFSLRASAAKGLVLRSYCLECENKPVDEAKRKETNRRKALMKRYKLTPEQFNDMGVEQKWLCAICWTDIRDAPYVDHNHETGAVRSLLCLHCNVGLGHFKDDIDTLRHAIEYLERHHVNN